MSKLTTKLNVTWTDPNYRKASLLIQNLKCRSNPFPKQTKAKTGIRKKYNLICKIKLCVFFL